MGSSWTRDRACVPCLGRCILNHWAIREALTLAFRRVGTPTGAARGSAALTVELTRQARHGWFRLQGGLATYSRTQGQPVDLNQPLAESSSPHPSNTPRFQSPLQSEVLGHLEHPRAARTPNVMTRHAQYPLVTVPYRLGFIALAFEREVDKLACGKNCCRISYRRGQPSYSTCRPYLDLA